MINTDALIEDLVAAGRPVKRLLRPELRALAWFAFAVVTVVIVMAVHGIDAGELRLAMTDPRLIAEEVATLVTAVSAAVAAFGSTVPGANRRWFLVPFAGLGAWVLLTGAGCAADYARLGPAAFGLRLDTDCFLPGAIAGAILTVMVIAMLRRGAPLVPRLTLVFAGMAVAATVNLGLLVLHEGDVSIILLVWHTGYVVGLAAIGAWIAPALLGWPRGPSTRKAPITLK
jgi:hypothetical protein